MNSALQVFYGLDTVGTMLDFFDDRAMIKKVDQEGYRHEFVISRTNIFEVVAKECKIETPYFLATPERAKFIRKVHGFKPLGPQAQYLFGELKAWTKTLQ